MSKGASGACTVLLNGDAVRACVMFAVQVEGMEVTTVEGIGHPGGASPVCRPRCAAATGRGFVTSITALLRDHPKPTDEEIREGCRATSAGAPVTRGS